MVHRDGIRTGLEQSLTAWYLTWGFLLKENMPSGSSSSDLSAMSLDVSFKDLSGVLGTGSGSGVVCEGEGERREEEGEKEGGRRARRGKEESEEREGGEGRRGREGGEGRRGREGGE